MQIIDFFKCHSCQDAKALSLSIPLCEACYNSIDIEQTPTLLCSKCSSPICILHSNCQHPWINFNPINSFHSQYLLTPKTYKILKNWKKSRGFLLNKLVLKINTTTIRKLEALDLKYIIPIPQHKKRQWILSGSPVEETAKLLSKKIKTKILPLLKISETKKTQGPLSLEKRISNTFYFEIKNNLDHIERDKNILIIDDFMTSGKTIQSAAITLKSVGFRNIHCFCLGYKPF